MEDRENYNANGCYMFLLKLNLFLHIFFLFICGFIDLVYMLFYLIYFLVFTLRCLHCISFIHLL